MAAAGAVAVGSRVVPAFAAPTTEIAPNSFKIKTGVDTMPLGKTGIKTSVLGIGTGTRGGSEQRALGEEGFVRLAREAFDRGIRYIDTADSYKMHGTVKAALKELPRDKLFVQTKTWARTADRATADLERLRKELDLETVDTMLIHCVTKQDWHEEMRPVIDTLLDAKRKGHVRAIGVSCHSLVALRNAVECPEMEVHLVRINPFKAHMDGTPEEVAAEIKRMHEKGRGVLGMKIFGESGFKSREERLKSLKYVFGLGTVPAFTIGFKSIAQIDETLKLIEEAAREAGKT